jgi:hypothetical protein
VPIGSDPVPERVARRVVEAGSVAVVRPDRTGEGLPSTVTFGGPEASREELLVRFPRSWTELDVRAAFLLLAPAADAEPSGTDVPLEIALAAGPWAPGTLRHAPSGQSPTSAGLGRTRPPALLRVDVTAQLKALAGRPESDHGLLVRASAPSERPATYLTGGAGGVPRLDVYGPLRESAVRMSAHEN